MSEQHPDQAPSGQPRPGEPGDTASTSDDAIEAELIRKVMRTQELHREGGIDPALEPDAAAQAGGDGTGHSGE